MPITTGAIRKLRADKRKAASNLRVKRAMKEALSQARKKITAANISQAFGYLDKAAKKGVLHKNTAARLKSRLAKKLKKK
jgi:small subunit ribosomal protein S20